jgi:hypothetical protein
MGKKIVVGYNDSFGFYDNRQGLSGFAYSVTSVRTRAEFRRLQRERTARIQPVRADVGRWSLPAAGWTDGDARHDLHDRERTRRRSAEIADNRFAPQNAGDDRF